MKTLYSMLQVITNATSMQDDGMARYIDVPSEFSSDDIERLMKIFGVRCNPATRDKMRRILRNPAVIDGKGILSRVVKVDINGSEGWTYRTGQSYSDEVRSVREIILGK